VGIGLLWAAMAALLPRAAVVDWEDWAIALGLLGAPLLQAAIGATLVVMTRPVPSRRARLAVQVPAAALAVVSLGALAGSGLIWLVDPPDWDLSPAFYAQAIALLLVLGLAAVLLRLRTWQRKGTGLAGIASSLAALFLWFWAYETEVLREIAAAVSAALNSR
jgi:hypothetical protein